MSSINSNESVSNSIVEPVSNNNLEQIIRNTTAFIPKICILSIICIYYSLRKKCVNFFAGSPLAITSNHQLWFQNVWYITSWLWLYLYVVKLCIWYINILIIINFIQSPGKINVFCTKKNVFSIVSPTDINYFSFNKVSYKWGGFTHFIEF